MIKTDIVAYVSSYALEGELIVPSAVLTSTPQEEEINLTYTPNFQLKLMDKNSYAVDDVLVSFSYADTNYTAHMNVVNRTQDGIVTLQYNNGLTTEEMPTPEPEPTPPRFTSPADGDTITGTIDAELQEFTYPIELEYGDGTQIPYDITSTCVTCDNSDISIGYTEDADENDQSYISGVNFSISQAGIGQATLTYEDPDTGDTCTATFDYDISAAQPEYVPLDVLMMTGNEVEWQSPSITDYIEVTDPYQNDPETGEPPLRVTADCTFSCDDSNITINVNEITASAPGEYEIIAQDNNTGRVGSVIWTITEGAHEA